jgi:hypothetical protein
MDGVLVDIGEGSELTAGDATGMGVFTTVGSMVFRSRKYAAGVFVAPAGSGIFWRSLL